MYTHYIPSLSVAKLSLCNRGVSVDEQARRINNQLFHIDRMLSELTIQNVTWLLVAGHYPIFSAGSDGDSAELQAYLLPLLEKYHVQGKLTCSFASIYFDSSFSIRTKLIFVAMIIFLNICKLKTSSFLSLVQDL